jgi:hypothetical protein
MPPGLRAVVAYFCQPFDLAGGVVVPQVERKLPVRLGGFCGAQVHDCGA